MSDSKDAERLSPGCIRSRSQPESLSAALLGRFDPHQSHGGIGRPVRATMPRVFPDAWCGLADLRDSVVVERSLFGSERAGREEPEGTRTCSEQRGKEGKEAQHQNVSRCEGPGKGGSALAYMVGI